MLPPHSRASYPIGKQPAAPRPPPFYSGQRLFDSPVGNKKLLPEPSLGVSPFNTIGMDINRLMTPCNAVNDQREFGKKQFGTYHQFFNSNVNALPPVSNSARMWKFNKDDRMGLGMLIK